MTVYERLAKVFGLPFGPNMQDWEIEVADPARVGEFLEHYDGNESLSEAERTVLMELIVASYDVLLDGGPGDFENQIAERLARDYALHAETVAYWARGNDEDCFSVRPMMLRVLRMTANRVTTKELRAVFSLLMDHVESQGHSEVNLDHDYYWEYANPDRYSIESSGEEPEPVVGQLSFDLEMIRSCSNDPLSYHLVYLAGVLRALGEQLMA